MQHPPRLHTRLAQDHPVTPIVLSLQENAAKGRPIVPSLLHNVEREREQARERERERERGGGGEKTKVRSNARG